MVREEWRYVFILIVKLTRRRGTQKKTEKKAPKKKETEMERMTHIIPVCFTEFHSLFPSLDTCTVHKHIDLPSHHLQSTGEDSLDVLRVPEVTVDHFYLHSWAQRFDSGNCVITQSRGRILWRAEDETQISPGLCERDGTCSTYACSENKNS
jgi:hypothetical protein